MCVNVFALHAYDCICLHMLTESRQGNRMLIGRGVECFVLAVMRPSHRLAVAALEMLCTLAVTFHCVMTYTVMKSILSVSR